MIFTVSASKLLVYDGNMQQLLMEHPIKLVSYVGDVGSYLVVMVRYQNHEEKQVFRVTCHVFQSKHSHQVCYQNHHKYKIARIVSFQILKFF